MRFSPIAGAMIACALLAVGGATTAGAAPKRVYKGSTAQDRNIRIAVQPRSIKILRFKAELRCRDGSILVLDESGFLRTPVRKGRFHDAQYGRTDEVFIRGTRRKGVVRGRLRVKDKLKGGVRCNSRWIKFTVRARGR
jgi:hypothetical protein